MSEHRNQHRYYRRSIKCPISMLKHTNGGTEGFFQDSKRLSLPYANSAFIPPQSQPVCPFRKNILVFYFGTVIFSSAAILLQIRDVLYLATWCLVLSVSCRLNASYPEDGSIKFLREIDIHVSNRTSSYNIGPLFVSACYTTL